MENIVKRLGEYLTLNYDQARSMPPEFYTSEEVFELEQKRLFRKEWSCLGRIQQIPKAGDYFATVLLDEPLIVVRTKSDKIRVLSNVCRHRGHRLVSNPTASLETIRCPYHSWTYNLDGTLKATPNIGGHGVHQCDSIVPENLGLVEQVLKARFEDRRNALVNGINCGGFPVHSDDVVSLVGEASCDWATQLAQSDDGYLGLRFNQLNSVL